MNRLLLVVGDDYWGSRAAKLAASREGVAIAVNAGTTPGRVARLLWRRSVPLIAFAKMSLAELTRPRLIGDSLPRIDSNDGLLKILEDEGIQTVILFRAGLIVSRRVIEAAEVLNVHCARLDGYGGLASIARALSDEALRQEATLHRVTSRIDEGEVLDIEPYELDLRSSYRSNEDRAYAAGLVVLERTLDRRVANAPT